MKKPAALNKPQPKPIDHEAARKFATQHKGVQELLQPQQPTRGRGRPRKHDSAAPAASSRAQNRLSANGKRVFLAPEGDARLTINLREELHRGLKHLAVDNKTTVGELVAQAITQIYPQLTAARNDASKGKG